MTTGAELFARMTEAAGVTHSFGVLGGSVLAIVQEIYKGNRTRFVPVRHEQVAASAADGFARISGRPAIAFGVVTAGATNLLVGVAIAKRDASPLLVITANEDSSRLHRDIWQGMDIVPAFRPFTKYSHQVKRLGELPFYFRNALLTATSGRPGPVHLDLPNEIGNGTADAATIAEADRVIRYFEKNPLRVPAERSAPGMDDVEAAANLLTAAERVTIAAGGGVLWSGASKELGRLAELLSAPVVLASTARGALPEDHPLCLGPTGRFGSPVADKALADADVVLALGGGLSDVQTRGWTLISPSARIIQNNIEIEAIGRNYPADVSLSGDARLTLEALCAALERRGHTPRSGAKSRVERYVAQRDAEWLDFQESDDSGAIKPQALLRTIAPALGRDTILTHGAGVHTMFASRLPIYQPRSHLKAIESAAMGFAFPSALGAKLAAPEREVVAFVGDGDFMMTAQDLETAVREKIPVTSIVFNNFGMGAEKLANGKIVDWMQGVSHDNPDFGKLATVFGGFGATVKSLDALLPAFEKARTSGGPAVLDVHIDPHELPRWMGTPWKAES